jgi:carbon monoxide dehydrogenase subunit G
MSRAVVTKTIAAPIERVFETIADLESFKRAIPHIVDIEFLSERRHGVGTRFRETRLANGRKTTTELEITECVTNDRLRIVTESHGTIWDSVFQLRAVDGGTRLTLTLDAKAHQLLAKLMNPTVMPAIRSAIEGDLGLVKRYCEETAFG